MTKEEYRAELHKQLDAVDALPDGCDIIDGRVGGFVGSSILLFSRFETPAAEHSCVSYGACGEYTVFSAAICGVHVEWNTAGCEQ